jgi:hypothetical protein
MAAQLFSSFRGQCAAHRRDYARAAGRPAVAHAAAQVLLHDLPVVLAFVGAFADSMPKGRVML